MSEVLAGRYRVDGVLGNGAMGVVYRAYDQVLDRFVALKELRVPAGLEVEEATDRFLVEARAGARLRHLSIVTVYDVVADDDRVLMSMELLEGSTLADALALAKGGLGADVARSIGVQIASALAEAHASGVIHRDLKPENVFWLPSGRVVVCDFGLARIGAGRGTRVGTVMGTPGYLSPEQVRGESAGPPADVFSWGALVYELISGRAAFGEATEDAATLIWRVVNEPPPPLIGVEPNLAGLVEWALRKDPADRPSDGAVLLAALGGEVSPRASQPPTLTASPAQHETARQPWGLVAGVVGVVVVLVGLAVGLVLTLGGRAEDSANSSQLRTAPSPTTLQSGVAAEAAPPASVVASTPRTTTLLSPSVVAAFASSESPPDPSGCCVYTAANALDGDLSTAWNAQRAAVGEWIEFRFDRPYQVVTLRITNGYAKNGALYAKNSRVREAVLVASTGEQRVLLSDSSAPQDLAVTLGPTSTLRLRIESTYPGSQYADIAITDVSFVVVA